MCDFRGKNAWFSSSASKECKQVWMKGGGKVVDDMKDANYVFADDSTEMSRFYKSRLFLEKGVQPFRSSWLLDTNRSIFDCILYPEDFKDLVSPSEHDDKASPTFHIFKEFRSSQSQDSEGTFCLDDYEILDLPNHEKSPKASPNKVSEASSLEWVCEDEDSSPTLPRIKESRDSCSKGSENAVHLTNCSDDDDSDDDDDKPTSHQLKSNISTTAVNERIFDIFEDDGSSPTFHRLKDFRSIHSLNSNNTVGIDDNEALGSKSLNSKTLDKTLSKEKEPTKAPIPSQNGYPLEKVNTACCQGTLFPVISSHENTTKSGPKTISSNRSTKKPFCAVISSEGPIKSTPVTKAQNKSSKTKHKEDRHYTVQGEELVGKEDSSSLKSFTEQDGATFLPTSVSLRELEIPTHVFHSSMHDGFTRLEDIELPEGLKLRDFFTKEDEETASDYQVYLRYPPTKVPKS